MCKSKIEQLICDKGFSYLQPYFYNNQYALRCKLGIGEDDQYLLNAKKRAKEIFNILFPFGADAIIFNYWISDHSSPGQAGKYSFEEMGLRINDVIDSTVNSEAQQLRFLLKYQGGYRHDVIRNLETYEDLGGEYPINQRRNRIVCFADNEEFDYNYLIELQISGKGHDIGFVSFENECILSIYDDRGCDIVFATDEMMKFFYHKLEPYFLEYDAEEMKKRFEK